ncbi:MAG: T9SS type A sorting domain-containing protein [Lentimicrobium sp.]|jgi:hypothetical protein|nr:T9SS type A sorting domain-containing protein [Lentimicrobium sp.]
MKNKAYTVLLFLFVAMQQGSAQFWEHYYGTTMFYDYCAFTVNTNDKGYLVGASTKIYHGIQFVTLYRTSFNGDTLWTKLIRSHNDVQIIDTKQTQDGGYICLGFIYLGETGEESKPFIFKLNKCAEQEWCTIFETDRFLSWAQNIMQTDDGGYILTLNSYGDYDTENTFLVKLDATGNVLWGRPVIDHNRYADAYNPYSERMLRTKNGDYLISGRVYWKNPFDDLIILRPFYALFDDEGNEKWLSPFGLADTLFGSGWGCVELENGHFMCTARQLLGDSRLQFGLIIEWDKDGQLIHYKSVKPQEISPECHSLFFIDILRMKEMYSLCMPYLTSFTQAYPAIISIDTSVFDTGFSIEALRIFYDKTEWLFINKTDDNKILSVNHHRHSAYDRDFFIAKMNSMLVSDSLVQDNRTYDSLCPHPITYSEIFIDSCRIVTVVNSLSIPENKPVLRPGFEVYPNPCIDKFTLSLSKEHDLDKIEVIASNIQGIDYKKLIMTGTSPQTVDVSGWPKGMYIIRVFCNGASIGNQKLVIL